MSQNRSLLGTLAAMVIVMTGCAAGSEGTSLRDKETLRIATKVDEPGLGNATDSSGIHREGFDVDVAGYIAEKLGFPGDRVEWKAVASENREVMIRNGQADLIVASYSITDERKKQVAFAGPYLITGQDIMIRSDDASIADVTDLRVKNKKVCSAINSTSIGRLRDDFQIPEAHLIGQRGYKACVDLLVSGKVDAVSTDDTVLRGYAMDPAYAGKVRVLGKKFSEERYGVGLAHTRSTDCERIVEILHEMIRDGSWQRFVDKNLGPELADLPPPDPEPSSCMTPS